MNQEDFEAINFDHVRDQKRGDFSVRTFDHIDHPLMGVGPKKLSFVDLEPYIDTKPFSDLNTEIMRGLPRCKNFRLAKVEGELPLQFREEYQFRLFEGKALLNASDEDVENMKGMNRQQRRHYAQMFLNCIKPWAFTVYLRDAAFEEKTHQQASRPEWLEDSELFPTLKDYILRLPFKTIGRILFFCTESGQGVPPHRDYPPAPHKDHNINFFFDGPRPSFIFDCLKGEKLYLQPTRAYFFNNRDYHGVDPEPRFRYTLRVDGTFSDTLQEALGLTDGWVCR